MKLKQIALLIAGLTASATVFANLETLPVAVSSDNIINMSGATAPTKTVGIALEDICASASATAANRLFITMTDGATPAVGKAWKCQVPAGTTFTKLTGVTGPWIVRKNEGGSLNGITPLRNGSTQAQLNTNSATCTFAPTGPSLAAGTCTGALLPQQAHIGISDVSQKVFGAKNQLVTQTVGNTYVADIAIGQIQGFGVAVSPALYALLQADQGVGAGIPSLSKNQMATLTATTNDPWAVLLPNGTAHPLSNTLTVSRRSNTSGTQASSELFFLKNPCLSGSAPLGGALAATAAGTYVVNPTATITVVANATSDGVINSVNQNTGYALGVASLENIATASSWKFVAIDGVHPGQPNAPEWQRKNIINGTYDFSYATFLFRNTKSTLGAALLNNISDFTTGLVNDLGIGANLNDSNGIAGDPGAPLADFGIETTQYARPASNECAAQTYQF